MATILTPLINGKSYEWGDIIVNFLNVPISGIVSLEYEERQDKKNIYGAGSRPVSTGNGRTEATAKVTFLMEEVEALQSAAPLGNLMNIPAFDVQIVFVDTSLVPRTHRLRNVQFMNNKRVANEGDQSLQVELDLLLSHIEWT